MEYIVIPDTCVIDLRHGTKDNEPSAILYRDENGGLGMVSRMIPVSIQMNLPSAAAHRLSTPFMTWSSRQKRRICTRF